MAWTEQEFLDALNVSLVNNSPFATLAGQGMPAQMQEEMLDAMERFANPIYSFVESWAINPSIVELSYKIKTDIDDPLPGYLEDKIDQETIVLDEATRRILVASVPPATGDISGGVKIGAQPYLYMQNGYLMLNAEANRLLLGGDNMVPTSRAVKLYVDSVVQGLSGGSGSGDMTKAVYDTDDTGVVDDAEKLGTQLPSYYLSWANFTDIPTTISGYGITDVYTESEIDAFFEGENLGKKQVDWDNIVDKDTVVEVSGLPLNNQVAIFLTSNTIEGSNNLLFDGTDLSVGGSILVDVIDELTIDTGVTIEGGLIKNNYLGDSSHYWDGVFVKLISILSSGSTEVSTIYTDSLNDLWLSPGTTNPNIIADGDILPDTSLVRDLGSMDRWWQYVYADRYYINNIGTYISYSGAGLQLTDQLAGTVTLSELVAGDYTILYHRDSINSGTTESYIIGNTSLDNAFQIRYYAKCTNNIESGVIYITQNNGVISMNRVSFGDNSGAGIVVEVSGTDIILKVTAPIIDILYFGYTKIYGDGPNIWMGPNAPTKGVTLVPNTINKFLVATSNHYSTKIQYGIVRGSNTQVGELTILYDNGVLKINHGSVGGNVGCTMDAVLDYVDGINYIYLTGELTVGETATMTYSVIYDDYDRVWDDVKGIKRQENLSNNTINKIIVGNKYDHVGLEIYYEIKRGLTTFEYQTGQIFLADQGTSDPYKSFVSFGDSCGASFNAEIDTNGNYLVHIIFDNSGTAGEFEFRVLPIDRPFNWDNIISQIGGKNINPLIKSPGSAQNAYAITWDNNNLEYTLTEVGSTGTYYWDRNGTYLSPLNPGDSILLANFSEKIRFGDGDSYIYEYVDDEIVISILGGWTIRFADTYIQSGVTFVPISNKTLDLGNSSIYWRYIYGDRLYIDNSSTYIDISAGDMAFTDANSGTVTLASLVAGVTSYWSKSGTDLSPVTAGDDILFHYGETLKFENSFYFYADGSNYGHITGGNFLIYPGDGGYLGIGDTSDSGTFLVIKDSNTTPKGVVLSVRDSSSNALIAAFDDGRVYMTQLAVNDLEDYLLAIDNSTGLLTKRSVNSLSPGYWTKTGTNLEPATEGDDILLSGGEVINFGTTFTTWIIGFPNAATSNTGIKWDHGDSALEYFYNNIQTLKMELDTGVYKIDASGGYFQGPKIYVNTVEANVQNDLNLIAANGVVAHPSGYHIILTAGDWYNTTEADAGNIYLIGHDARVGDNNSSPGSIYLVPGLDDAQSHRYIYLGNNDRATNYFTIETKSSNANTGIFITSKGSLGIYLNHYNHDGGVRIHGTSFYQYLTHEMITRANGNTTHMHISGGGASTLPAGHLILQGGTGGDQPGAYNGANVYIYGGLSALGTPGDIYFGDLLGGKLSEDTGATHMVTYNTTTGKLSYKAI